MSTRYGMATATAREYSVKISDCARHPKQKAFIECKAKRIIVCAGRRGGKTEGVSDRTVQRFLMGRRELYTAPTQEQVEAAWKHCKRALAEPISAGVFTKNETMHTIDWPGTEARIRCKTAWDADTLRGDYADDMTFDEWQLCNEDAWALVGAPMLMDNNGDAAFVYTPPSLHSRRERTTKARDPQHAAKMFKEALADTSGRWATFHWTSRDNGYISSEAIDEACKDMTSLARRMEIDAEDIDEAPGALWKREDIDRHRIRKGTSPDFSRIVIGVDPTGSARGDECGIVAAGRSGEEAYVIEDASAHGRPEQWATAVTNLYRELKADCVVAEINYGGEMVEYTIHTIDPTVNVKTVTASRGKAIRAEPVSALYEKGRIHHLGEFPLLESELCLWVPGDRSPNRLDGAVWALTELMLTAYEWGSGSVQAGQWGGGG